MIEAAEVPQTRSSEDERREQLLIVVDDGAALVKIGDYASAAKHFKWLARRLEREKRLVNAARAEANHRARSTRRD